MCHDFIHLNAQSKSIRTSGETLLHADQWAFLYVLFYCTDNLTWLSPFASSTGVLWLSHNSAVAVEHLARGIVTELFSTSHFLRLISHLFISFLAPYKTPDVSVPFLGLEHAGVGFLVCVSEIKVSV